MKRGTYMLLMLLILFALSYLSYNSRLGLKKYLELKAYYQELSRKNEELERENERLRKEVERLKSDLDYIRSIARKKLGMVKPDEVILSIEEKEAPQKKRDNKKR